MRNQAWRTCAVALCVWAWPMNGSATEYTMPTPFVLPGGGEGVILNASYQRDTCIYARDHGGTDRGACDYWAPTKEQVLAIDRALVAHLRAAAPAGSRLRKGLSGHHRQYLGEQVGKMRLVRIYGACNKTESWLENPVQMKGGGECYFTIAYDVGAKTFRDLLINSRK